MLRGPVALALVAALALPASAEAWVKRVALMPGVTYKKEVRWAYGGPLVTHVISAPRPLGLYDMKPVLSHGTVLGRERVTSMQRRLSSRATVAGVNGDYFSFGTGRPSGMFMRDGVLASRPWPSRSTLGVAFNGTLRVRRWRSFGSWQVDGFAGHRMRELNRRFLGPGAALFTPSYGGRTPTGRRLDIVLSRLAPALVNGNLRVRAVRFRWGGGTVIPRGGGVLQTSGRWRRVAVREARPGRALTLRIRVRGFWTNVADAIGGGPVLVRDGRPISRHGEDFTQSVLAARQPRTAVGQLANGRVILVVVDGRSRASRGVRSWELALEMARLGAVRAMGLDGGGSSTLAFNGRVLNRPADGAERPVGDGLIFFYYGVYAPRLARTVVSPNGDGVDDVQRLAAKIVRRSSVDVRLVRPNGTIGWRFRGVVGRRFIRHVLRRARHDGRWRWVVQAQDMQGRKSRMMRSFTVNNTLGHLRLSKPRMRGYRGRGGSLVGSVDLARRSAVRLTIRRASDGGVVRRLHPAGRQPPGTLWFRWDGRGDGGSLVPSGTYVVRAQATNEIGRISLERAVRVFLRPRPA